MHCGTNRIGPDGDYQTAGVDSEIYILNAEINELKYQLRNAQVISKNNTSDESEIDIGDTVTLLDVNKGEIRLVKLAGGIARLGDEIPSISLKSPMGRSIIGKNVGDVVSYDVKDKNGKVINHVTVQILEVKKEKVESKEKS